MIERMHRCFPLHLMCVMRQFSRFKALSFAMKYRKHSSTLTSHPRTFVLECVTRCVSVSSAWSFALYLRRFVSFVSLFFFFFLGCVVNFASGRRLGKKQVRFSPYLLSDAQARKARSADVTTWSLVVAIYRLSPQALSWRTALVDGRDDTSGRSANSRSN